MPAVYVLDLKVRQNTRRLYAGTHGLWRIFGQSGADCRYGKSGGRNPGCRCGIHIRPERSYFSGRARAPFSGMIRMTDITGRAALTRAVDGMRLDDLVLDVAGLPAGICIAGD
jgi:hypothetical protein